MDNWSVFCYAVLVLSIGPQVHESVSVSGPCFVNHHTLTRSTFKSVFEKTTKKDCFHCPPSVGPCLSKILKEDADLHGILEF